VKDKPPGQRWQALFGAVVAHGPTGVIALALIVVLACVITGVSAPVIYAIVVLIAMMIALIVVADIVLRRTHRGGDSDDAPKATKRQNR
jgi:hypothetical protein